MNIVVKCLLGAMGFDDLWNFKCALQPLLLRTLRGSKAATFSESTIGYHIFAIFVLKRREHVAMLADWCESFDLFCEWKVEHCISPASPKKVCCDQLELCLYNPENSRQKWRLRPFKIILKWFGSVVDLSSCKEIGNKWLMRLPNSTKGLPEWLHIACCEHSDICRDLCLPRCL